MVETYPQSKAELESEGYAVHTMFRHTDIVAFVRSYFFRMNPVTLAFWIFNALVVLLFILNPLFDPHSSFAFHFFLMGFAGFFLLIPLHELIHGIGYRFAGAKVVSYRVVWRKLIVYAMADRFVAHRVWFTILALAPFVLINTALIVLVVIASAGWSAFFTGVLIMHTAGCSGDFALVSYFYTFWDRHPITFDEEAEGRTFFMLLPE